MVVAGVLTVLSLVVTAIVFREPIGRTIDKFTGKTDAEKAEEKRKEEAGAFANTFEFFFGKNAAANVRANQLDAEFKLQQEQQQADLKKQAASVGLSLEDFLKATDTNINKTGAFKFNPTGTIGFGIKSLNGGRGVPDTPENRALIENILNPKSIPTGRRSRFGA